MTTANRSIAAVCAAALCLSLWLPTLAMPGQGAGPVQSALAALPFAPLA